MYARSTANTFSYTSELFVFTRVFNKTTKLISNMQLSYVYSSPRGGGVSGGQ